MWITSSCFAAGSLTLRGQCGGEAGLPSVATPSVLACWIGLAFSNALCSLAFPMIKRLVGEMEDGSTILIGTPPLRAPHRGCGEERGLHTPFSKQI